MCLTLRYVPSQGTADRRLVPRRGGRRNMRWLKVLWQFGARGVPACVALHPAADVRQRNAGTHWWIIVCLLRYTPRAATVGVARLLVRVLAAARVGG